MLKDACFKPLYSTGDDDEPSDFLYEGLTNSQHFDFGLGYFRSTGFNCLAIGFASFLQRGGSMRFIINDSLAEKDKAAILQGQQEQSDEAYEQTLLDDLEALTKILTKRNKHFFSCLSWLISSARLQVIAVVPQKNKVGIVHHKFGIFTDEDGDQAVFNGSVNFSQYAIEFNVECIWCEYSWEVQGTSRIRMDQMINLFENTWNGTSSTVRIIPIERVKTAIQSKFPKKTIKELVEMECDLAREVIEHPMTSDASKQKMLDLIAHLQAGSSVTKKLEKQGTPNKWLHQDKAVAAFLKKERGVLNMATGTGKTRTALRICKTLIDQNAIDTIVIACDGTDLLDQWYNHLLYLVQEKSGWVILRQYGTNHQSERLRAKPGKKILLSSRQQLHLALGSLDEATGRRTILIHDEVHRLGSPGNIERLNGLSDQIRYRLGLSATPEREYDQEGTRFILSQVGAIIFNFTMEDGIRRGILAPFNYFPVNYTLTSADRKRLRDVYKRKAASEKTGSPMPDEEFWNELARVYKTAEGKIPAFRDFIRTHSSMLERCIVFTETKEFGEKILDIIHRHHTDFHAYYGGDDQVILQRFAIGEIECLLTCHRLSEGIDIQSLKNVILISSAKAKLETIQRIGRCLRIDPSNPDKIANVIDLVRANNEQDDDSQNNNELNADQERQLFLTHLANIRPEKSATHFGQ